MTFNRASDAGWDWLYFPKTEGTASRTAGVSLPEGTYERSIGREGFSGPGTRMYHTHMPTEFVEFEGPLRPRAWDLDKLNSVTGSPWDAIECMRNDAIRVRYWRSHGAMDHLVRNADGDDMLFIHMGSGDLYCDYGHLKFRDGDHILMPRGTMWRIEADGDATLVLVEATNDSYRLPDKGLVGPHVIVDPGTMDTPEIDDKFKAQQGAGEWQLRVKRSGEISAATYAFNPLDAVGWHGSLAPARINWRDVTPLNTHRGHVPVSAHTMFVSDRFVICAFVPRPLFLGDPDVMQVPPYHSNDDVDEIAFYHAGNFNHRDDVDCGTMTFLPAGLIHGPHPNMMKNAFSKPKDDGLKMMMMDGVALSIDVRDGVEVGDIPEAVERPDWHLGWQAAPKAAE